MCPCNPLCLDVCLPTLAPQILQRLAYKYYGAELLDFSLSSVGAVGGPDKLRGHLSALSLRQVTELAQRLQLLPSPVTPAGDDVTEYTRAFVEGTPRLHTLPLSCVCVCVCVL